MTVAASLDPEQVHLMQERIILVDAKDTPVGEGSKWDCHLNANIKQGMLHRAFSLFLFSTNQQEQTSSEPSRLLMQQRAGSKITFPALWTNTCCSHPWNTEHERSGVVGSKRAAIRKLDHELGISSLSVEQLSYCGRIRYQAESCAEWGEHEIDYLLVASVPNGTGMSFDVNPNEVMATRWISLSELDAEMQDADRAGRFTPWFLKLYQSGILRTIWSRVDQGGSLKDASADGLITHL